MSDETKAELPAAREASPTPASDDEGRDNDAGPLLDFEQGEALEGHDRKHSGPGGEPVCPRCGAAMVRSVEQHRAPRSDDSPFRIRLVCGAADCRAWTIYNW